MRLKNALLSLAIAAPFVCTLPAAPQSAVAPVTKAVVSAAGETLPPPECFGKPATHVFLPDGDTRDFRGAVETSPEDEQGTEYFRGSGPTRDVMVAIQRAQTGGVISAPYGQSDDRNLPGDVACGSTAGDAFYTSSNVDVLDKVRGGGATTAQGVLEGDNVYGHGGSLIALMGGPAGAAPEGNRIWPGRVPSTGRVRIIGSDTGTDHVYQGVNGKGADWFYNGRGGMDHLHPCITPQVAELLGLPKDRIGDTYNGPPLDEESFEQATGIELKNVEMIVGEAFLNRGDPQFSPFDACRGSA